MACFPTYGANQDRVQLCASAHDFAGCCLRCLWVVPVVAILELLASDAESRLAFDDFFQLSGP
jgi:hypothetical protein